MDFVEEFDDVLVGEADAAGASGGADELFFICAVDANVSVVGIAIEVWVVGAGT